MMTLHETIVVVQEPNDNDIDTSDDSIRRCECGSTEFYCYQSIIYTKKIYVDLDPEGEDYVGEESYDYDGELDLDFYCNECDRSTPYSEDMCERAGAAAT